MEGSGSLAEEKKRKGEWKRLREAERSWNRAADWLRPALGDKSITQVQ